MSLRIGAGRALPAVAALVLAGLGGGTLAAVARAEGCPNEQLRGQEGYALSLPDCRAYEQVSPVDKNFTDALGEADVVQSSPSGDGVTFFSDAPFPGVLSATGPSLYLSTRAGGEWSTQGLVPPTAPRSPPRAGSASVLSLTEDLSEAIVNTEPGLEAGMAPGRYSYLRDNATGSFRLLGPASPRSRTPRPTIRASSSSPANNSCRVRRPERRQPLRMGREQAARSRTELGRDPARRQGARPAGRSPVRAGLRLAKKLEAARRASSTRRTRSPRTAPASSSATPGPGRSTCANRKPRGRSRSRRGSNRRTGGPRRPMARRSSTPKAKTSTGSMSTS